MVAMIDCYWHHQISIYYMDRMLMILALMMLIYISALLIQQLGRLYTIL